MSFNMENLRKDDRFVRGRSVRVDIATRTFHAEGTARAMALTWQVLSVQRIAERPVQLSRN